MVTGLIPGAQVDSAGIDMLLVGDSVAMVVHGHDTTLPVTVDDMLVHCRAVARGARRPFLIADLPFGSYEASPTQAVQTAIRFLKHGNMDAIKLEGALSSEANLGTQERTGTTASSVLDRDASVASAKPGEPQRIGEKARSRAQLLLHRLVAEELLCLGC